MFELKNCDLNQQLRVIDNAEIQAKLDFSFPPTSAKQALVDLFYID
jgi:hypothetical protein